MKNKNHFCILMSHKINIHIQLTKNQPTMKRLLLILLLFVAYIDQTQAKVQVGVGVKVGPAFGRWNNDFFKNSKLATAGGTVNFLPGLHAGIQSRVWFNKFVGINLAAEFNMSGSKFVGTQGTVITTIIHKENQLTIPLTALVGWGNERLRIYGQVGGFFGYNINGKDKTSINNNGSTVPSSFVKADYKNVYQNIDAGIRFGGGIQVYVDKGLKHTVTFDVGYDYGFIKTFRNEEPAYFNQPQKLKIAASKLLIGVGYSYSLGKSQAEEAPKRATSFD